MISQRIYRILMICFNALLTQEIAPSYSIIKKLSEKQELKSKSVLSDIEKYTIKTVEYVGDIIQLSFVSSENFSKRCKHSFFMDYSDSAPTEKSLVYFSPIYDTAPIERLHAQYKLLKALTYGDHILFDQAIKEGAHLSACNKIYRPLTFIMRNNQKKIASWDDIQSANCSHLEKSKKIFFGTNTFNWDIFEHTKHACNVSGMIKLLDYPYALSVEERKSTRDELEELEKEQQAIQNAQTERSIATFDIASTCASTNDDTNNSSFIWSTYEDTVHLMAHISKNEFIIGATTPKKAWKYTHLDIDALAKVYAHAISTNDSEGKKIARSFAQWKGYRFFKQHVLRYLVHNNIEKQCYCDVPLLLDNLMILANNIITHDNIESDPLLDYGQQIFFNALLGLCTVKIIDKTDMEYDWLSAYYAVVEMLLSKAQSKEFLKELCCHSDSFSNQAISNNLHAKMVKPLIRQHLFRAHLAKLLTHSGSQFTDGIAQHIASYWKLNKQFIEYYKKKKKKSIVSTISHLKNLVLNNPSLQQ